MAMGPAGLWPLPIGTAFASLATRLSTLRRAHARSRTDSGPKCTIETLEIIKLEESMEEKQEDIVTSLHVPEEKSQKWRQSPIHSIVQMVRW